MLALKITDQKDFTNKLFLGDTFDLFWLEPGRDHHKQSLYH